MTTVDQIFKNKESLTYDDIIFLPYEVLNSISGISLKTQLTKNISINLPFVSSPMDTVTESKLAIKLALLGGCGIIHCNNTIKEQVSEVLKVKRFNNNFILEPIVVSPNDTVLKVRNLAKKWGFSGFPVTYGGNTNSVFLGIVSEKEVLFDSPKDLVKDVMVKVEDLIVAKKGISIDEAFQLIKKRRISKLPITDESGKLVGLFCRRDLKVRRVYPNASKDSNGQLIVGAAVTTHKGDRERIKELVSAGVDFICIDSSNGCSIFQIELIKHIKKKYPGIDIVAGNVVTRRQAKKLIESGADALRVGMGIGSICTTQNVLGVGRAQASAVYDVSITSSIPLIADGGISNSGQMAKALLLGANTVMMGSMFACTDEAPGDTIVKDGIKLKVYRGHGSLACHKKKSATQSVSERYMSQKDKIFVSQGVSGMVVAKGSVGNLVPIWEKSIKHTFQHIGINNIQDISKKRSSGDILVERRTIQAQKEGSIHNLYGVESYSEI